MRRSFLLMLVVFLFSISLVGCDLAQFGLQIPSDDQSENENGEGQQGTSQEIKIEFAITFDEDGGSSVLNQIVLENGKIVKPADPTKEGYTFLGWYINDVEFNFDTLITGDITLVAKWKLISTHTPGISASELAVELNVGDSFNALEGISVIDEYGNNKLDEVAVNHFIPIDANGCLTQAGEYKISYSLQIGENNYSLVRDLKVNAAQVVVNPGNGDSKYANLVIDHQDGTVGKPYNSTLWLQEAYNSSWTETSNQMNCREKDGVRVVNFTSGYSMTFRYTYRQEGGASLGIANKLTFKAGNYWNPKEPIPIKIIIIDMEGNYHYLAGNQNEFYSFAATDTLIDQEFIFEPVEVFAIRIVCKGAAQAYQYFYVGAMHLSYDEEIYPIENGDNNSQIEDNSGKLNILADLTPTGSDYVSEFWTCEQYQNGWVKLDSVQMRSRARGDVKVANFATVKVPMRYTFSKGESLGLFDTLTFKASNDWNDTDGIHIIFQLIDVNGNEIFIFGSNTGYDTIPPQELTQYEFHFDLAEIKEVVIMTLSDIPSTYLYIGDFYLSNSNNQ